MVLQLEGTMIGLYVVSCLHLINFILYQFIQ